MPGQFINTGTTPGGSLKLANVNNQGSLKMGAFPSFTLNSSDFAIFNYGGGVIATNASYEILGINPTDIPFYGPNFDINQGGNIAKADEIAAYFTANGLTINSNSYLFNVSYGPGSTVASGIAAVSFTYYSNANVYLQMGTVDTGIAGWDTPGTPLGALVAVPGTYNLPFTFTVYRPIVQDNASWC